MQARSRAKYDAILEASTRVLLESGYRKTTTENIALEADVAIGTLYEYFRNKDDIFAAYIKQQMRQAMSHMAEEVLANLGASVDEMLELIIHIGVEFILERQQIFGVIVREIPELWEAEVINKIDDKVIEIILNYADHQESTLSKEKRRDMAAFLTNVIMGVYMRLTVVGLNGLKSKDLEQELLCVIRGYIQQKKMLN